MEPLLQDIRYGFRMLRKTPGFTLVAVITLALGIGANVAIFSFVDEMWLRPFPVRDAGRLVRIFTSNPSSKGEVERGWNSYPDFADLRTSAKTLSGVALLERRGALYDDGVQNNLVTAAVLSDNFFDVLQPLPALGRTFTENELKSPQALPVILSYPFWRRQFGGDVSLVGRTIVVDRQQVAVVGILPRGFRGTEAMQVPDLWIPMTTWGQLVPGEQQHRLVSRGFRDYELFGRLGPGVTLQQAGLELAAVANALAQSYPDTNAGRKMTVVPETETRGDWTAKVGLVLLGIAALVLLIACANVASLLLARAEHRRKEIATRVALGAVPGQIVRQLLTETMLLTVLGTAAALVFGNLVLQLLPALLPQTSVPSGVDAYLSLRGFLFAMVIAVVSLFVFGLAPALQASHVAPALALKQLGATGVATRRPLRSVLVVAQVALSAVMVVSAGLLVRSVLNALNSDPGFNAHQNMLVLELVPGFGTRSSQESLAFVREARRRLEALPGVTATSIAMRFPFGMSGSGATRKVFIPELGTADREGVTINFDPVGDGFFSVLGTRILRGRAIEAHDLETGAHVTVVNQQMARRFWPNGDAVGKRIRLDKLDGAEYQVIGVAEVSKYNDYQEDPMPFLYVPMESDDYSELALAVSTGIDPGTLAMTVRRTLRDINREVPILGMLTWRDQIREALYEQRMTARLIVALGGLGLLLAAVGIYGLMAFLVARRTQEIGIRLALGAQRSAILRLVMRHALGLTAVGLAAGILGSIAATRALRSFLFGVAPTDVLVFVGAITVLVVVTFAATLVPAMRAIRVDPMVALRYE
ncbi:MAG: ABC transporter permease [Acidobacteriia bacterium]|nr:ABC transporter permease [Terriglobia bacterium]